MIVPAILSFSQEFTPSKIEFKPKILIEEYEDLDGHYKRSEWQKVDEVIRAMDLKKGDVIADIGCGSGYFSRPFARSVGSEGIVYCCDLESGLLDYVQQKAKEMELHNIVTVYAAKDRPMLPPNSVDYIFSCNVHHYLENPVAYYRNLKSILKPNGKLIIIVWNKILADDRKTDFYLHDPVINCLKKAGWQLIKEDQEILDRQLFLFFQLINN